MSPEDGLVTHDKEKTNKRMKIKYRHIELSRVEQASWIAFDCHFKDELHSESKYEIQLFTISNNTPETLKMNNKFNPSLRSFFSVENGIYREKSEGRGRKKIGGANAPPTTITKPQKCGYS